ncbi:hypothetical protein JXL19_12640 [bacterium]|nr:hypothetical protein [bacterium]
MDEKNWTEYEYLEWFKRYLPSDWGKFIEHAGRNHFDNKDVNILNVMCRRVMFPNAISFKQLKWAKRIVDQIEMNIQRDKFEEKFSHCVEGNQINIMVEVFRTSS